MSFNDGYLSSVNIVPREGNDGYLFGRSIANGVASITFTLSADPVPNGVASITFALAGEGKTVAQGAGIAAVAFGLLGIGTSNRGNGLATIAFDVTGQANPATGLAEVTFTVSGTGDLFSRFAPKLIWPGFSSDTVNITIPIAELGGQLTAAEANATTGDMREVLQALLLSVDTYHNAMAAPDRPKTFQSNALVDWNYNHRSLGRVIKREIWERIVVDYATRTVADEV